jgi:hypothetical protein
MAKISDQIKETTLQLTGKFSKNFLSKVKGKSTASKEENVSFSGKAKEQKGSVTTASKIKPLKQGNELIDMLMKIYDFMDKTHKEDTLKNEESNNFKEGQKIEDGKRHDKLIKAIEQLKKDLGATSEDTATPVSNNKGLDLSDIFDLVNGAKWLLGIATSPAALIAALVGAGLFASLKAYEYSTQKEKDFADAGNIKALESQVGATQTIGGAEMVTPEQLKLNDQLVGEKLKESKTPEGQKAYAQWLSEHPEMTKAKVYNKDTGIDEIAGDYLKSKGYEFINKAPKKEQEEAYAFAKVSRKSLQSGQPVPVPGQTPVETTIPTDNAPTTTPATEVKPITTTPAMPAPSVPASAKLNTVQSENNTAKVNALTESPSTTVNNSSVTSSASKPQLPNRTKIPAVRNMEESFQKMIIYSTRVV